MNKKMIASFFRPLAVLAYFLVTPTRGLAGPPLICHPFEIGGATSLPWGGTAWSALKADYDVPHLVQDTLALLAPEVPVIVRMETLRRAAIYARKDPRTANELIARLMARALDAEAKGKPGAKAWFDAGYLVEAYKQAGFANRHMTRQGKDTTAGNSVAGLDGYAYVLKAIGLSMKDPEMEFAAALITIDRQKSDHHEHLRKAVAGAADGSLLARNLVRHFGYRGRTMAELRVFTKLRNAKN